MHVRVFVYACVCLCTCQVREAWQTYELDLINYQNKCKVIRGLEDLFVKVKEHTSSVSAMKLSPYYKVSCVHRLALALALLIRSASLS